MTVPGRLHITWQDTDTLASTPMREADAALSLHRACDRNNRRIPRGRANRPHAGSEWPRLTLVAACASSVDIRAGYLRKNGVPYSERATVSEHFDIAPLPDGRRSSS